MYFYIQAYNGTNQPAKVLDAASELLSKDLKTAFPDPKQQLQILYPVTFNAAKIAASGSTATPTPEELATGEKAATNSPILRPLISRPPTSPRPPATPIG